jgi:hypothetical protein
MDSYPLSIFYFTIMAKEIILTQGKVAIVDDEDYDYLNQFKWHVIKYGNIFYAYRNIKKLNGKRSSFSMHRTIMNANKGYIVDHINQDTLDNRKINLRICTQSQNQMNRNKTIKNKTGYKGVIQKGNNKFGVQITLNKKIIHIGYYIDPIDAARAYNSAALKYHGEFANLNKID